MYSKNIVGVSVREQPFSFNIHAEWTKMPQTFVTVSQSDYLVQNVDIDSLTVQIQISWLEANWSGSTLFSKAWPIRVQQDKG